MRRKETGRYQGGRGEKEHELRMRKGEELSRIADLEQS
jgi:hypothetical protein